MPAQGDLNRDTKNAFPNPFEDVIPRVNEFTAKEIIVLQNRLDKQLGPEYISSRPGAGGSKVHYIAAEKVINLANEVFGFNGWSSELKEQKVDFCDLYENGKVSLGVSTVVRVSLKDGTSHEDVGYGHIENCKGKAAAFEKAKKESATDALKRALRNFGNVLGNCLYDKDYLNRVTKVKVAPTKWDVENLHRHPDFAPIKAQAITGGDADKKPAPLPRDVSRGTDHEDEFGGDLFDEVDIGEANPDEVILHNGSEHGETVKPELQRRVTDQAHPPPQTSASRPLPPQRNATVTEGQLQRAPRRDGRMLPPPTNVSPGRPAATTTFQESTNTHSHQYETPTPSPSDLLAPQTVTSSNITRPLPTLLSTSSTSNEPLPPTGFVTWRNAAMLKAPDPPAPNIIASLPRFDPSSDSPSIRKTSGVNHAVSRPLLRQAQQNTLAGPQSDDNSIEVSKLQPRPSTNFVNPAADLSRRIGMPGGGTASPLANRSAYKPPGPAVTKRPADVAILDSQNINVRTPLTDVSNTAAQLAVPVDSVSVIDRENAKKVRTE